MGSIWRELRILATPVPQPKQWVFLVGCYNSGTTLLAEVLGEHPQISALPTEGHFITDQFVKDFDIGLPRMWVKREDIFRLTEKDNGPDPIRVAKEWGMRLNLSKPVLLEKSPPNAARTRWLQANFPNARFIALVRNGYAVSEGIARKADPKHLPQGWPIRDCAHQWARSNEVLLEDSKHLQHCLWVKYEDFTDHPLETLERITDFLELEKFGQLDLTKPWGVHERREAIKNMNHRSISRLTSAEISEITAVAGTMLEHFGYSKITPPQE